ncbi:sulfatase [candidate division KSB1 bacterium]|nr:sulfatase [candidate division KSB1 bacterium]
MDRRKFLKSFGACSTAFWFSLTAQKSVAENVNRENRPNFIFIFADDMGYGDLGCFGSETIKTPRIDQLSRKGFTLKSFYSQPVCGPARISLLSGCYPKRVNRMWNLPGPEITVAEILKNAGYSTGCIGKWDLSNRKFLNGVIPNDQGFDYYFGTLGANDDGTVLLYKNKQQLHEMSDMGSLTKLYTDEAIKFIRKNKNNPFFLYLPHTMPHVKIGASNKFKGVSKGGLYGDVIEEIDWNVGRIIDIVKELGLVKKTYIFFTSDNGPWLSKGDRGGSAGPLRNGKGSAWEGGYRVPCIIWAPGRVPEGKKSNELIATLDIMPTLINLAGLKAPEDRIIDGVNQSDFITGKTEKSARETFYYYVRDNLHAVRRGKWKLALPGRKKFFNYAKDENPVTKPELYDLENDISEKFNLADSHPGIVKELLQLAAEARRDMGDVELEGANVRNKIK